MLGSLFRSCVPDEAIEFAGFVLAHCAAIADANREGELICPFAVLEREEGKDVVNFESDTQEEAVAKGWAMLDEAASEKIACAFGREGLYREPDGTATDVVTVTVWIPGMKEYCSVLQRFGRSDDQAIYLIGAPELLEHKGNTAEPAARWNDKALERGIAAHPQGAMWLARPEQAAGPGQ